MKISVTLGFLIVPGFLAAQATFQNLDFELASVPDLPANQFGDFVAISDGMPGWSLDFNGLQGNQVLHNNFSVGSSVACIFGPNWSLSGIIEGKYTAILEAGAVYDVSLGQTGFVPTYARSIMFKAVPGSGPFSVSLGGSSISVVRLQTTSGYTLYGGEIAGFAGQTAKLEFTATSVYSQGGGLNFFALDSIEFSQMQVPEPSTFALFSIGALAIGWRIRKRLRRWT